MKKLLFFKSENANECHMTKIVKLRVIPPPKEGIRTVFSTHDKDALVKGLTLSPLFVETVNLF
ncbi:hypothetical protein [Candidatus Nitrosocosmicus arcticus]|uniref:Uncharacterized protein n=1 Tax=Candidatus Nitrosocosmicus arcticus TaxID=2035267 RepID=A0A557SWB6_9ARCH|nr:hypothetical protein [Candidatus Nitrosocosmicus arcticus]TVP40896.1 hypothetical protein NARC_50077 [Candidatus Nitrosocosmicus arcticus]